MTALIGICRPEQGHGRLLVGIAEAAPWALFLAKPPGDTSLTLSLERAFPNLRGIGWECSFLRHESPFGPGGERGGILALRAKHAHDIVATTTIANVADDRDWSALVTWLPPEPELMIPEWMIRDGLGDRRAAGMLPDDPRAASAWAKLTHGLMWLRAASKWNERPTPMIDLYGVIKSFVQGTLELEGVPILSWTADLLWGVVLFGDQNHIESTVDRLAEQGASLSEQLDFERLWNRGFYLSIGP